jgi:hypothetical protein
MPLTIRHEGRNPEIGPHHVYCGDVLIGIILHHAEYPRPPRWTWTLNGLNSIATGMHQNGRVDSYEEAKREIARQWRKWVDAAKLREV